MLNLKLFVLIAVVASASSQTNDPCGTFVPYDITNSRTAPETDGVVAGINLDGSPAYVGFGDGTTCNNQDVAPCSISTSASSPGCNIPCGASNINDLKTPYYLKRHNDLLWVTADSATLTTVQNPIRILGPFNLMIGRALVNGNYVFGKIQASNGVYAFQAVTGNGATMLTSGFDVLTCRVGECACSGGVNNTAVTAVPPAPTPPVSTTPQYSSKDPCGTFVFYDSVNAPNAPVSNGFPAGVNDDNTVTYVGVGDGTSCNNQNLAPCAVSTSSSPGCFIPCGSSKVNDARSSFYLLGHNSLVWVTAESSTLTLIQNPVRVLGPFNFMIGRALVGGTYLFGKIQASNGIYNFQGVKNNAAVTLTSGFDVLTCQIGGCTCVPPPQNTTTVPPLPATTTTTRAATNPPATTTTTRAPTTVASVTTAGPVVTTVQPPTLAPNITDTLSPGQSINSSTTIRSSNGQFTMGIVNGALVVRNASGVIVWSSNTTDGTNLTMDNDGGLDLYNAAGVRIWSSRWYSIIIRGSSMQLTGSGVFNVYNGTTISYSSGSNASTTTTSAPATDTLSPGQSITNSTIIRSGNGQYSMSIFNGALVVRNASGVIIWSSNTTDGTLLTMDNDGGLDLYNAAGVRVWSSRWSSIIIRGSSMQLTGSGVFNVFSGSTITYSSAGGSATTTAPSATQVVTSSSGFAIDFLSSGQTMNRTTIMRSSNGQYWIQIINGSLVIVNGTGQIIWSSNSTGGDNLRMETDGTLNLYNAAGSVVWSSSSTSNGTLAGATLQLTNMGALYISKGSVVTWNSGWTSSSTFTIDLTKYQCGTFMQYDPVNYRTFPDDYGFNGGLNYDSTAEYVGYGTSNCGMSTATKTPGFISTGQSQPGAYLSCNSGLIFDNANAFFLLKNSGLSWVNTDSVGMLYLPNKLALSDNSVLFYFGRFLHKGEYRVGRILVTQVGAGFYFVDDANTEQYITTGFQILTCIPPAPLTKPPTTTSTTTTVSTTTIPLTPPPNMACSQLLSVSMYSPATYGLASGTYFDGQTIYPGAGVFGCVTGFQPARITTAGASATCIGGTTDRFDNINANFFSSHTNLKWIATTGPTFNSVWGKIKVGDYNGYPMYVGRMRGDNYTTIAMVWKDGLYYLDPVAKVQKINIGTFDLLACNTCGVGSPPYCCENGAQNSQCQHSCGALLPLNAYDPATYGLASGTYLDGNPTYPGIGASGCTADRQPARIVGTATSARGAYSKCPGGLFESFDSSTAAFFVAHPNLKWTPTSSATINTVPGKIAIVNYNNAPMFAGRAQIAASNGTFAFVSVVYQNVFYYIDPDTGNEKTVEGAFDVLTCS